MFHYLATPYSHDDRSVEAQRYYQTLELTTNLIKQGIIVFSPIVYCHQMAVGFQLGRDASYWQEFNTIMLDAASGLVVGMLDGWDKSVGVRFEIEWMQAQQKPILYVSREGFVRTPHE